jgi:hypothetical protein
MESAITALSIEGILSAIVYVVVMYLVILKYALPYNQVVLTYVGLTLLSAILAKLLLPTLQIGEAKRPVDVRTVSRQALSLLSAGLIDLVVGIASFIAILVLASYRFTALQIFGIVAAGWATGIVSNTVLGFV